MIHWIRGDIPLLELHDVADAFGFTTPNRLIHHSAAADRFRRWTWQETLFWRRLLNLGDGSDDSCD